VPTRVPWRRDAANRSRDRASGRRPRRHRRRHRGGSRMSLVGRAGLVTGGGSGIGRATAELLAARGGAVVVADVNRVGAEEAVARIRTAGGRAELSHCDVTQAAQVEAAVTLAVERYGRLDLLINCAGILRVASLEATSEKEWGEVLAVNLTGAFLQT